jgi:indole-3-glycerol phosphate synthase
MNNILDRIIADKKIEIGRRKSGTAPDLLEKSPGFSRKTLSLRSGLASAGASGIIAEFKRMSPSAGWINRHADPVEVSRAYLRAGASALSVLTDHKYFGGRGDDLLSVREACRCPILRKEFIIDEYQLLESRSMGADAVLLIASILDGTRVKELAREARNVGLEVILEVHGPSELSVLNEWIDIVGVNNRDLKRMETDVQTSIDMAERIPDEFLKISESGIHDPETINFLKGLGYRGFLIGEYFMRHEAPGAACRNFIEKISGR